MALFYTVMLCATGGFMVGSYLPGLIRRLAGAEPAALRSPLRIVESTTAVTFAALAWRLGLSVDLPAFLYLAAVGVALAFIDIEVKRLPNPLTLPSYVVGGLLLGFAALAGHAGEAYVRALIGMAALYGFYLLLAFIHPSGMGLGDVKLAGVLGLYLAWLGWGTLIGGAFLGFLLGGLSGVALLLARRATRKSSIPFGPFMLLGALIAIIWGQRLADAYVAQLTP